MCRASRDTIGMLSHVGGVVITGIHRPFSISNPADV